MEGVNSTQTTSSTQAQQPLSTTFDDSIVTVLNLLSGKKHTVGDLSKMKITEDVLYASLVYDDLRGSSPETAKTFTKEIKERFDRRTKRNDSQPLAKAIDDILDNSVKAKKLTAKTAKAIISESFGRAQLDKTKGVLGRSARESGINAIKEKVAKNGSASEKVAQRFETAMEETKFLLPSVARRQRSELTKVIRSLKQPATENPSAELPKTESPTIKTPTIETDKASPLPDPAKEATGPNDFIYKPQSVNDGLSIIILPTRFASEVSRVDYIGDKGSLETLTHTGLGNDGRRYFRSKKKGVDLPGSVTVRLYFTNGTELDLAVADTKSVYKRSYTE